MALPYPNSWIIRLQNHKVAQKSSHHQMAHNAISLSTTFEVSGLKTRKEQKRIQKGRKQTTWITPWKWQTTYLVQDFEHMTPSIYCNFLWRELVPSGSNPKSFCWTMAVFPAVASGRNFDRLRLPTLNVKADCSAPVVICICFWGPVSSDPIQRCRVCFVLFTFDVWEQVTTQAIWLQFMKDSQYCEHCTSG